MPVQSTEIASTVSSDSDDIIPTVRRRLYRRRPMRVSATATSAELTQVRPTRSSSRGVEDRDILDTPHRCGCSSEPVVEVRAKRTGRQEKRALDGDSDTDDSFEQNTGEHR
ncbi:hypothetical protein B0A55_12690 [Friedmanniomyces simplex]|uniref:Uncharacterized protein n=1 Tax=Friedmanniomyces simplex TaxID=329884 RepID=A0A4U0WZW1_9PEZI|nr:hypothetical protein B0A55_12690 [Friedmanniomyces simplex]